MWACRNFTKCGAATGDKCCSDNPKWLYSATICHNRVIDQPCDNQDTGYGEDPCDQYCQDKQSDENPQPEVTAEGMIDPDGPNTFYELWNVTTRTQFFIGGPCLNYGDPSWTDYRIPVSGSYSTIGTGGASYTAGPIVTYPCPTAAASGPDYITRSHTSSSGSIVTSKVDGPLNFYSQFTATPILSWSVKQVWTPGNPANAVPASELVGADSVGQGDETWAPDCAPGCECTKQGFISAEGKTVYFYKECCYQDAPEELNCEEKECDCVKNPETCDQECDTCELCDRETNKCVEDVGCQEGTAGQVCIEGTLPDGRTYSTPSNIVATRFGAFPSSWGAFNIVTGSVKWLPAGGRYEAFVGGMVYDGFEFGYVNSSNQAATEYVPFSSTIGFGYPYKLTVVPTQSCPNPEGVYIVQPTPGEA